MPGVTTPSATIASRDGNLAAAVSASVNANNSPNATASGTSNTNSNSSKHKKFTTISGLSSKSKDSSGKASSNGAAAAGAPGTNTSSGVVGGARPSVKGLFDGMLNGSGNSTAEGGASASNGFATPTASSPSAIYAQLAGSPGGSTIAGAGTATASGYSTINSKYSAVIHAAAKQDGPWSVSVAEVVPPSSASSNLLTSKKGRTTDKGTKKSRRGSAWNAFSAAASSSLLSAASSSTTGGAAAGSSSADSSAAAALYTLYISTPTHNLTLTRSAAQIVTLDQKLRDNFGTNGGLPTLPASLLSSLSAGAGQQQQQQQQTGSRKLLQTISRTLNPSYKARTALGNLTAPNLALNAPANGTAASPAPSETTTAAEAVDEKKPAAAAAAESTPEAEADVDTGIDANEKKQADNEKRIANLTASPELVASPPFAAPASAVATAADGKAAASSSGAVTSHLATYLTTLANLPTVRTNSHWKRFVRVEADDLQSTRVERRIKKVRSDLAKHVKSNVAPKNININNMDDHDPSQSDLGEDGARTEEDEDGLSAISGRSNDGRASFVSSAEASSSALGAQGASTATTVSKGLTPAKQANGAVTNGTSPEVPTRSTSVDTSAVAVTAVAAASASSISIAAAQSSTIGSIPEEEGDAGKGSTGNGDAQQASEASAHQQDSSVASSAAEAGSHEATTAADDEQASAKDSAARRAAKKEKRASERRKRSSEKVTVDDFEMIRVLGKGCAGKVLLVRHTPTKGLFAMKSIHKRHVLAHQELQHTLTEQAVLKRMAKDVNDPFVVKLWWSFHDKHNLYLVMDFHPGGDLATQLSRWGRLGRDRARFYAAEIVEGVEGLHRAGVIYRDLKPENVLIGSDGHIVLSDFGLSKEFPQRSEEDGAMTGPPSGRSTPPGSPQRSQSSNNIKAKQPHWMSGQDDSATARRGGSGGLNQWKEQRDTTTTFCGTAEYLAPEVIQGAAYSYEVDWWSFGTMLYEMLTGITPFWADTHADMYVRVLHDDLVFPEDRVLDTDTKSILRGLLQRNPILRMKEPRIKKHPYFSMIEWAHVFHKRYIPPYVPPINPMDETDTQNFDEAFLDMQPTVTNAVEEDADEEEIAAKAEAEKATKLAQERAAAEASAKGQAYDPEVKSLFDGYSYRARRDSESIKSTIMSISSDGQPSNTADTDVTADTTATTAAPERPGTATAKDSAISASTATDVTFTPTNATNAGEESEDEDAAARAAVAALARLEREASADLTATSSPSARSSSTRPTSATLSRDAASSATSESEDHSTMASMGKTKTSRAGVPSHEAIVETDDEDDDWDMIDGTSEPLRSEVNGGKGQNLFARGVVDTYRLLRRQEPLRPPTSPGAKALNRLSRRQGSSSDRQRQAQSSKSNTHLRSPSPNSLSSENNSAPNASRDSAVDRTLSTPVEETDGDVRMEESASRATNDGVTPSTSVASKSELRKSRKGNASMGSSEDLHISEKVKQPKSKRMKRFTTFFVEAASKFD